MVTMPLAGVDERAAAVGRGNVGVIIGVAQPNRLTVLRFGNFKGIRPLAQNRACRAGFGSHPSNRRSTRWVRGSPR